jgi:hypothetical protein
MTISRLRTALATERRGEGQRVQDSRDRVGTTNGETEGKDPKALNIIKTISLWQTQGQHPSKKANDWAGDLSRVPWLMRWSVGNSRRGMVGYWVPLFCWVSLWIGAVLAWFRVLKPT